MQSTPHRLPRCAVRFRRACRRESAENYLQWVRGVAEAHWATEPTRGLPWWRGATDEDEIADPQRHADARMFDGLELAEERQELTLDEAVSQQD